VVELSGPRRSEQGKGPFFFFFFSPLDFSFSKEREVLPPGPPSAPLSHGGIGRPAPLSFSVRVTVFYTNPPPLHFGGPQFQTPSFLLALEQTQVPFVCRRKDTSVVFFNKSRKLGLFFGNSYTIITSLTLRPAVSHNDCGPTLSFRAGALLFTLFLFFFKPLPFPATGNFLLNSLAHFP